MAALTVFTKSSQPVAWGPLTYAQYLHDGQHQVPEPVIEASEAAQACAVNGHPSESAAQAFRELNPRQAESSQVLDVLQCARADQKN